MALDENPAQMLWFQPIKTLRDACLKDLRFLCRSDENKPACEASRWSVCVVCVWLVRLTQRHLNPSMRRHPCVSWPDCESRQQVDFNLTLVADSYCSGQMQFVQGVAFGFGVCCCVTWTPTAPESSSTLLLYEYLDFSLYVRWNERHESHVSSSVLCIIKLWFCPAKWNWMLSSVRLQTEMCVYVCVCVDQSNLTLGVHRWYRAEYSLFMGSWPCYLKRSWIEGKGGTVVATNGGHHQHSAGATDGSDQSGNLLTD